MRLPLRPFFNEFSPFPPAIGGLPTSTYRTYPLFLFTESISAITLWIIFSSNKTILNVIVLPPITNHGAQDLRSALLSRALLFRLSRVQSVGPLSATVAVLRGTDGLGRDAGTPPFPRGPGAIH